MVNVLLVSAIELKKKKHSAWMLDTGFLQQLVVRLFTLSSSLQFAEASTASRHLAFHQLDPCSGKGKNLHHRLVNSDCRFFDLSTT